MPILIFFLICGAVLGWAVGYYLTTLLAVLFTVSSYAAYQYFENTRRDINEDWYIFTFSGILVANIIMWITSLVFVGANWEWLRVLVSNYIFRR